MLDHLCFLSMIFVYTESNTSTTTVSLLSSSLTHKNAKLEQKLNENGNKSQLFLNHWQLTDDDMGIVAQYLLFNNTVRLFITLTASTYIDLF